MTETTQTGLSENNAGALAYITIIPAILFLVMPPYNKSSFVRFHAWQCVFLNVACMAILMALFILHVVLLAFSPFGIFAYALMLLFELSVFILWLVVVLKALNGERFSLPLIGPLAEKQASK